MVIAITSCRSPQHTISKSEIDQIEFGGGGGFTGQETTYTLTAQSKLLKEKTVLKEVDPKQTADLFEKAVKIGELNYNKPGNIYSFIRIKTTDHTNPIIWAKGKEPKSKEVIKLYQELQNLTK